LIHVFKVYQFSPHVVLCSLHYLTAFVPFHHRVVFPGKSMNVQQLIESSTDLEDSHKYESLVDILFRVLLEFGVSPSILRIAILEWILLVHKNM